MLTVRPMRRALLLSLLARQSLVLREAFRTRYPHAWLVWEAGVWNVPDAREQNVAMTRTPVTELRDCLPTGDVLCFELAAVANGEEGISLGRAERNALVVNDATISRDQLLLERSSAGDWTVRLTESGAPATVDGVELTNAVAVPLRSGMKITAGDVSLTFYDSEAFALRVADTARKMMERLTPRPVPVNVEPQATLMARRDTLRDTAS